MRRCFYKLNRFLLKRSYGMQVLILYLAGFAIIFVALPLRLLLQVTGTDIKFSEAPKSSDYGLIIAAWIIAPLVETLICQWLTFKLFKLWNPYSRNYIVYIIASALLFALGHTHNVGYMIQTFFIGITLNYAFYFYKKNISKAFWTVALIHAMHNITVTIIAITLAI